jgi:hypothetical protein
MKQLTVLLVVALLLIPVASAFAGAEETASAASDGSEENIQPQRQLMVYYFHGTRRCKTCLYIESTAHDIVGRLFAAELESGRMAWNAVNYDEPENEHFVKEFGLVSSSLVLVEMINGKPASHEVLQKSWTLARDKPAVEHYIKQSVLKYLESDE